jgi:7-keto-8-aminopelargonate synthetase-like enzyme
MTASANALSRNNAYFANPKGPDIIARLEKYHQWIEQRHRSGFWPYSRTLGTSPHPEALIGYLGGPLRAGINLAVQDYLGLSTREDIKQAAVKAAHDFGVHSAGSAMLLGNNPLSLELERKIADFVEMEHVLLFPTGWAAGYGTVKGLIREHDHIVLDSLAHACLQEGTAAATRNVHRYSHLDNAHAERILRSIRASDAENAILVVTEGLFSMDSDSPDLPSLLDICRAHGASLLVDVAHDLGALGPKGAGQLGKQGLLGKVDFVMGAFSKTFASNGGFLASNDYRVKQYLKWFANPFTFSNAMSPLQCAIVAKAIDIVGSNEGDTLRQRLWEASTVFRARLSSLDLTVLGDPSAIVPVLIGRESVARLASREVAERDIFTNLVEFPAVALGAARFRCQLMATHQSSHIESAALGIAAAIEKAREIARGMATHSCSATESDQHRFDSTAK